jgi:hypothetical protein
MYADDMLREMYNTIQKTGPCKSGKTRQVYDLILDVFVTKNYTAEGAWGHTEPHRRVVCRLPSELLDYRFMDPANSRINEVDKHEALHNIFPGAGEGYILRMGKNPHANYLLDKVSLRYHMA